MPDEHEPTESTSPAPYQPPTEHRIGGSAGVRVTHRGEVQVSRANADSPQLDHSKCEEKFEALRVQAGAALDELETTLMQKGERIRELERELENANRELAKRAVAASE